MALPVADPAEAPAVTCTFAVSELLHPPADAPRVAALRAQLEIARVGGSPSWNSGAKGEDRAIRIR
jgi:hypothetical protein